MIRVKLVVILSAMMLSDAGLAQDNESVSPAALELTRRGNSAVAVLRPTGEEVFLPVCRGIVWERFVQPDGGGAGRYVSLTAEPCGASKPPVKVSKDGTEFVAPPAPGGESMVVRAVAVVGVGCAEDRPMSLGGCASVTSLVSSNITLSAAVPD